MQCVLGRTTRARAGSTTHLHAIRARRYVCGITRHLLFVWPPLLAAHFMVVGWHWQYGGVCVENYTGCVRGWTGECVCICLESIAVRGSAACSASVHCCLAVPCCMVVAVFTCRPPGLCAGCARAALQDAFARGWVGAHKHQKQDGVWTQVRVAGCVQGGRARSASKDSAAVLFSLTPAQHTGDTMGVVRRLLRLACVA